MADCRLVKFWDFEPQMTHMEAAGSNHHPVELVYSRGSRLTGSVAIVMVTESRDMSWDRVCVNTFFFGIFLFDYAASWTRSCVLEMSHRICWCLRCISSCVMFSWSYQCISNHSLLCLIKNKPQLSGPRWESRCPLIIFRAWLGILRSTEDISWSLRCVAYKFFW